MIRKYIIIGKQLIISSAKFEVTQEDGLPGPIEIRVPVDVLWQAQELLKESEVLVSSGDDTRTVKEIHQKVLKLLVPHCVAEKDRLWLYEYLK